MVVRDIVQAVDGRVLVGEDQMDREIKSACGADLMSDVLAFVKEKTLLITGLTNLLVVRTAEMLDITCILFARGKVPSEDILQEAKKLDLIVLSTDLTTYTACGVLYKLGLPGTEERK
ncbi:MAG: hypothetical protein GX786_09820 [Clostridiales bacterium]|nr:hypothetical protein [Clostridiales bacterium]